MACDVADELMPLRCTLMRGGTSKAVFLRQADLPADDEALRRLLLALFGSPDKRQIDGLGGADPLTSKCACIGAPSRADADVDYRFVQVGIDKPEISFDIVCGNISSAVGVYAIEEGLVAAHEPHTLVRIHNLNTGRILRARVPVAGGKPRVEGDCRIDGVPGSGAAVWMDYSDSTGGATGRLLPTGRVRDRLAVPALGREIEVSIVDVGTLCVFFDAAVLGLDGAAMPADVGEGAYLLAEAIRRAALAACGLDAAQLLPFQIAVAPPTGYDAFGGTVSVQPQQMDLSARMLVGADRLMHKAIPGGGAVCTAVAARLEGSLVQTVAGPPAPGRPLRIGHPSGVLSIASEVEPVAGGWQVRRVEFARTARRLMDGTALVRRALLEGIDDAR